MLTNRPELTIPEAAEILRVKPSNVRYRIKVGKLPARSIVLNGKRLWVIHRRHLNAYDDSRRQGQIKSKQISLNRTLAACAPESERGQLRIRCDFDQLFENLYGREALGGERHKLYTEFLQCDGDLFYLIWLEGILIVGDLNIATHRDDIRDALRDAKLTGQLRAFIESPFMDYVGMFIVAKTAESIENNLPSNEWLEKTSDSIVHEACLQAFAYRFHNSKLEKQKRAQKSFRAAVDRFSPHGLGEVIWEYAVTPNLAPREKGGNRPDDWGKFFLTVLAEHLNGHYRLCHDLLNLFRGKTPHLKTRLKQRDGQGEHGGASKGDPVSNALTQINQLRANHANLPQHLSLLHEAYQQSCQERLRSGAQVNTPILNQPI